MLPASWKDMEKAKGFGGVGALRAVTSSQHAALVKESPLQESELSEVG